jgi:hypothetical protein
MMEAISIHDPRFVEKMQARREESEWSDADFDQVAKWRALFGEKHMSAWAWWWADAGDNEYSGCCDTREAAIAEALVEGHFFGTDDFELIEARSWTDELADDDFVPFAETRNAETLRTEMFDGVRRLAPPSKQTELFEGN